MNTYSNILSNIGAKKGLLTMTGRQRLGGVGDSDSEAQRKFRAALFI